MIKLNSSLLIGIILGLAIGISFVAVDAATLFTVQTDTGSLLVSSTSGVLPLKGGTGIKVSTIGSNVFINNTRIITTGPINQIRWGADSQNNYLSTQMELTSQYPELVKNSQPYDGTLSIVTITPLVNTMQNRADLILYDNGISTGKTVIIPAGSTSGIITTINYQFVKGDSLTWKLVTLSTDANSLLFNGQVMINYNG